jgi:hypothetical protein
MSDTKKFDVFLCHNSQDKPAVEKIAEELKIRGIKPWLDKWELQPGLPWQPELERQIKNIRAGAVFVGSSGLGPWQNMEIRAFLQQFVKRGCPVIPVLLTNGPKKPKLPLFLEGNTWVDFRDSQSNPMDKLVWGITGKKPIPQQLRSQVRASLIKRATVVGAILLSAIGIYFIFFRAPDPVTIESQPSDETKMSQKPTTPTIPELKGDYSNLEKLLDREKWYEADMETQRIMLEIAYNSPVSSINKMLYEANIDKFPCPEMKKIDQLWLEKSNSKFGFSVQKNIYQSLGGNLIAIAGNKDRNPRIWKQFGEQIGWRKEDEWVYNSSDFTFNLSAPSGHLPARPGIGGFQVCTLAGTSCSGTSFSYDVYLTIKLSLLFRAETCNL